MEDLLTEQAVADYLGVSIDTLRRMRWKGTGPAFFRISPQRVMYKMEDVQSWLALRKAVTQ